MVKSIIPWIGGKGKLMGLIRLLAPAQVERSVDVFGGSGVVILNLEQERGEKVYNDYNADLVNLMRCARETPLLLIQELGFMNLNARGDFEICKQLLKKDCVLDELWIEQFGVTEVLFPELEAQELKSLLEKQREGEQVKRAATYYKLLRYSYNSNGKSFAGRSCDVRRFFLDIWKFSEAFREIVIEQKDFQDLIHQYDGEDTFFYCDPPYYQAEGFYEVGFGKEDHLRLRNTLDEIQGYVLVSYNYCEEVMEWYENYYIFYTTRPHPMKKKEGALYEELLITNYDPRIELEKKKYQLHLFDASFFMEGRDSFRLLQEPKRRR